MLVGSELLQFGSAKALGGNRFRLSRLLRGRMGSEWAIASHQAGELFVLLDPAALSRVELPSAAMNTVVTAVPLGLADDVAQSASRLVTGEGLRPPSPAHLTVNRLSDGAVAVTWIRRSRLGWSWNDGVEVPVGEAVEQYRIRIQGAGGTVEKITTQNSCRFEAAELVNVGSADLRIAVAQLGDFGASHEAMAALHA